MAAGIELTTTEIQALISGLPKYCPSMNIMLDGEPYTTTEVVQLLQTVLDALTAITAARTALAASIAAGKKVAANEGVLAKEAREVVAVGFANTPAALDALAITPRKSPKPLSAEARLAATAKARATRIARGTTSKKEKAKISGGVTGVTVTPVTSGTAASMASSTGSTGAPAPSTSPASPGAGLGATATGGSAASK